MKCPSCNRNFVWEEKGRLLCPNGHSYSRREANLRQGEGKFLDIDRTDEAGF